MTEGQISEAVTTTEPTLFAIASDLECIYSEFHRVENMLSIYDERIEDDIEFMSKSEDGYVRYFASRYDILFDYGNLRSTAPTIDNFDGSFDPEFQKQLAERGLTSLPAPLYVRFMSEELAKKIDRYFIEKYGRGYY